MSTPSKSSKAKMQIPVIRKFKKFVRSWRKKPQGAQPPVDVSSTVNAKVISTTISPLLLLPVVGGFAAPPLTFPASPRSGRSDASFLRSPRMEKSTSGSSGVTTESSTLSTTVEEAESSEQTRSQKSESQETDSEASPVSSGKPELPAVPSEHADPGVPDPFLVDDSDSDEELSDEDLDTKEAPPTPAIEISLAQPSESTPVTPLTPNVNKAVPPPPQSDDEEEDEAPDLYLPGLVIPTMFLPIPNTDPLTTLLTKYITQPEKRPARDLTGDWQRSDFHTLVMSNSWRALARMARDRIVTTNPEELGLILGLWYLRLSSLARLRLYNQTSAELTNLFTVLNGVSPPSARSWLFDRVLPFELEVMHARVKYWAGDHMGYLDALYWLLKKCKGKARLAKGDETARAMWQERGARVCLIIASQLVEMKDFAAAVHLLEPLAKQGSVSTSALRSAIARIYLQAGYISKASEHFAAVKADPEATQLSKDMNDALLASAEGDWQKATQILKELLANDPDNFAAVNNLSVALLSQGNLKEGIDVLETALQASPSTVVVAEPFLFNLSTLYELRSATAAENKRDLLVEVAKWSGDGLKVACLKMPSN